MNLFADDRRISGKAALKEAPGKQDYWLAFRLIFRFREEAAEGGSYAEERKEIGRAACALMKRELLFLAQRLTAMAGHHHEGQTKFAAREKEKPSKPARKPEA